MVDKSALNMFFFKYVSFSLSVSFHQCSTLTLIFKATLRVTIVKPENLPAEVKLFRKSGCIKEDQGFIV
jgi:hypothetical protein